MTDPPQLVSNDPLTFYSGLGQQISLNITVRAFPEFSDPDSAFTWTTSGGSLITNGVTSAKLSDEIFHSELLIGSVTREDYTSYTVAVDNGIKEPVSFTLKLIERGIRLDYFVCISSHTSLADYLGLKVINFTMEHHLCIQQLCRNLIKILMKQNCWCLIYEIKLFLQILNLLALPVFSNVTGLIGVIYLQMVMMFILGLPYPPESLTFESVTSISITLSWISSWNGGSLQTFTVYHRKDGDGKITYNDGIADTGFGTKIFFKATDLEPNTLYFFRVQSKNMHGESILPPEIPTETLGLDLLFTNFMTDVVNSHYCNCF